MRARQNWIAILVVLLAGAVSCEKKEKAAAGTAPNAFAESVVEGLQEAGLEVGELETAAAKPYKAQTCSRGEVSKLDVLTCQYENEKEAEQARQSLEKFVAGAGSGAVRISGTVALAVADRAKVDPRGKLVDKLLKAFAGLGLK